MVSESRISSQCWSGHKKLCQCIAPGSDDDCVPTRASKENKQLSDSVTACNNGCLAYLCGVDKVEFWKREGEQARVLGRAPIPCVHLSTMLKGHSNMLILPITRSAARRQPYPCCSIPDPQPTNTISSRPLTPERVHDAFHQLPPHRNHIFSR